VTPDLTGWEDDGDYFSVVDCFNEEVTIRATEADARDAITKYWSVKRPYLGPFTIRQHHSFSRTIYTEPYDERRIKDSLPLRREPHP